MAKGREIVPKSEVKIAMNLSIAAKVALTTIIGIVLIYLFSYYQLNLWLNPMQVLSFAVLFYVVTVTGIWVGTQSAIQKEVKIHYNSYYILFLSASVITATYLMIFATEVAKTL